MPTLAYNKRAKFDYDLLTEFEGGLVLTGAEVKAAKKASINMQGAFLTIRGGELWLKNMHIGAYTPAGRQEEYDPTHDRKVLVRKRELKKILSKHESDRLTIMPISVYTKGGLVKISFALARGKKKHEKRETIKKRDVEREINEEMKKKRFNN